MGVTNIGSDLAPYFKVVGSGDSTSYTYSTYVIPFPDEERERRPMRRIVKITVVDPDPKVPADHSLLFMSEGWFVTDCNDDELKMQLDIVSMFSRHNAYREQVVDKEASKGRAQNVYLDPINIRDLHIMVHKLC